MRRLGPVLAAVALAIAGCAPATESSAEPTPRVTPTGASPVAPATSTSTATIPPVIDSADAAPNCPSPASETTRPVPTALSNAVATQLADPRWAAVEATVSVWIDGYGEVASLDSKRALLPASNQKLWTAVGAHLLVEPSHRFTTRVLITDDTDLVLVAGGDPTLSTSGANSLDALAAQVLDAGAAVVRDVIVDAGRYERRVHLPGWQAWQMPTYVGPMSALLVDANRYRTDRPFLLAPAIGGGERFVERLRMSGVAVEGTVRLGSDAGREVAQVTSPPVGELLTRMLTHSDNMIAESLVREIGVLVAGDGSTSAGIAAIGSAVGRLCLDLTGTSGDGSGLSRDNRRSAAEWVALLRAVRSEPWFGDLLAELAIAGETGTLRDRLRDPATAGVVRAKTGSIIGGRALSGYGLTQGGRLIVFSMIVNGEESGPARSAIDELLVTIARDDS